MNFIPSLPTGLIVDILQCMRFFHRAFQLLCSKRRQIIFRGSLTSLWSNSHHGSSEEATAEECCPLFSNLAFVACWNHWLFLDQWLELALSTLIADEFVQSVYALVCVTGYAPSTNFILKPLSDCEPSQWRKLPNYQGK